jgi:hypothetical protein
MRRNTTAGDPEQRRQADGPPPLRKKVLTRERTKRLLAKMSQEIEELRRYRRSL